MYARRVPRSGRVEGFAVLGLELRDVRFQVLGKVESLGSWLRDPENTVSQGLEFSGVLRV